jgi:hypothetical protein
MIYDYDYIYKTKIGYVFQLNVITKSEVEFNFDRAYTYVYSKFNFFNNIKNNTISYNTRFSIYYSFIEQGWFLIIVYDYIDQLNK